MELRDDELQEILTIFKSESEEHLQKLNEGILSLERDPAKTEVLEEIFREAHSLKGAARMIGFEEVEKVAHHLEDLFNEARQGRLRFNSSLSDYILEGLDIINRAIGAKLRGKGLGTTSIGDYLQRQHPLPRGEGPPRPEVTPPPAASAPGEAPTLPAEEAPIPAHAPATPVEIRVSEPMLPVVLDPGAVAEVAPEDGVNLSLGVREEIHRGIQEVEERIRIRKRQEAVAEVSPQYRETIRVPVEKLDELMAHVGEILVSKIRSDQRLAEMREFQSQLAIFQKQLSRQARLILSVVDRDDPNYRTLAGLLAEARRAVDLLADGAQHLGDGMADENLRLDLLSSNVQESVNQIRMLPLAAIFNYFPRLVRDISREQGKEVNLLVRGGETRLDKRILEELKDPLTHLLRNSIDHGLEVPEDRMAAGKPLTGKLVLTAAQKGNSVLVELEDDGRGIDPVKVRDVALRRGFISSDALTEMTTAQIIQIIFQPGFSTKNVITDVSGRGVGLDVVLTNIERLKGKISTVSHLGRGTKFSITLPLTLATTQSLLVATGGQRFAIPITAVEYTGEVDLEEISTVEGKETVLIGGEPLSLVRLSEVLELQENLKGEVSPRVPVVVLSSIEDRMAFTVDEFIGEKEIVVKSLGAHLVRVPNVAGATILADGTPVMILNVFDLIKNARKIKGEWVTQRLKASRKEKRQQTILVVDDSITTRTLEKNILESSGFQVITATDGVEALEKVRSKKIDLVVTDIQMPRMDGFTLSATLKKDTTYRGIPIILVTSLESEEDRRRGIQAGADAYVNKGAFDQYALLETIRRLL
jgi:two-component system chemotaxis sensor kinase CheA